MLDMCAARNNSSAVPLADRFQLTFGRWIQRVSGTGARQARLVVGAVDIVQQLVLRCAPIDTVVLFRSPIENPAVAGVADLPLEFEFEISELFFRYDVGDRTIF